ncbi:MAG: Uma2 family endonuclease [Planctomycetaceae bacterium]|nr:Uma2 family endonuclease [Planctomycetaceae bacterium]
MSVGAINFADQVRVPADVFDLHGFRAWAHSEAYPETGKICFVGGEIEIDMSPEEINTHNAVKSDLYTDVGAIARKLKSGRLFVDGAFLVNETADLATEPDLMFCLWETLRSGRVVLAPWTEGSDRMVELQGTPDLVVEIISNSSVRKDTIVLRKAYFEAGIPEYWLIDARGKSLDFQVLKRGKSRYVAVKPDADGYCSSPVLGRRLRLARGRDPLGGACYRLRIR